MVITVLNFRQGTVHFIYDYEPKEDIDTEDHLTELGFETNDCNYMVTETLIIKSE